MPGRNRPRRGAVWLCAVLLAGCTEAADGDGGPHTQFALHLAADEAVFVAPALQATVQQFVGPPDPETGPGGLLGGIGPGTLSPDSSTPYALQHSARRSISAGLRHPLGPRLHATARASVGTGRSRYVLPEGAGILDDPISIRFDTRFATAEAGLAWDRALTRQIGLELGLAAGMRVTRTRTHISSALLDVRNISQQQDAYVALRAGVWAKPNPASAARVQLDLETLAYPGKAVTLGAVLSAQY